MRCFKPNSIGPCCSFHSFACKWDHSSTWVDARCRCPSQDSNHRRGQMVLRLRAGSARRTRRVLHGRIEIERRKLPGLWLAGLAYNLAMATLVGVMDAAALG